MGLIRKISNTDEFREKLTEAQLLKMDLLDKELSATSELVKLGNEQYQIDSFDMSSSLSFSKFQSEYREIIRKNPNVTFEELLSGEDSIVCKILNFFDIDIDPKDVTYRQFKYLMWVITKNYVFTSIEDSNNINAMTPFFFV